MLLSSAPHSAQRFSAPIPGLRCLLAAPDASVVTRAALASARCRRRRQGVVEGEGRRDGTSIAGHRHDDCVEDVKADEEEGAWEDWEEEDDEEEDGCWVSYGRRCTPRRLPRPLPSLVAWGALRRTRTDDGRLVIRTAPVARARRRSGAAPSAAQHAAERQDDDAPAIPPPPLPAPVTIGAPRRDETPPPSSSLRAAHDDDDGDNSETAEPGAGDERGDGGDAAEPAAGRELALPVPVPVPPPRVASAGCFEDVFKYDSIGRSRSLHQMYILRMVH